MLRRMSVGSASRIALGLALSVEGDGVERGADGLPTAFRLFKAGANETTKGTFLFDAKAAEMVMSAAKQRGGVEYMIDLEHLALDQESRAYDPDARGWFTLDVRGGELWAVNVRWSADGARRLAEKTQRYVSPAFLVDDENRITEILNVALVAMPATHGTPALVAANRRPRMTVKEQIAILADDGEGAPAGKAATVKAKADAAITALDELQKAFGGGDIDATFAAMEAAKAAMAECEAAIDAMVGGGSEPAPEPTPEPAAASADEEERKQLARDRAELIALRAEKRKRAEDEEIARRAAELTERNELKAKLVKMGRETPASAELLNDLPIWKLRERVKLFEGAPPAFTLGRIVPPFGGGLDGEGSRDFVTPYGRVTLTANQLRECERAGAKPEVFAENMARRIYAQKR